MVGWGGGGGTVQGGKPGLEREMESVELGETCLQVQNDVFLKQMFKKKWLVCH